MKTCNTGKRYWWVAGLSLILYHFALSPVWAQSDFGMWYELAAEKKLAQWVSVGAETEFRTRNNTRTADRWSAGVNAEFRIIKGLKASAGYTFLYDNNPEKVSLKSDNVRIKKWRPSYWGAKHRVNVSLTGSINLGRLNVSLRERWQFTHRPSVSDKKYNVDKMTWSTVEVKNKHLLRSRLQLSYDFPHWKFDPFANVELFNGCTLEKIRFQAGVEYKFRKQHTFQLTYRYQDIRDNEEDGEVNSHLVGLSYKFKF
ncbi:MAG: DUF2490 domain-containing protein [Prevotella sp.]|nr:DUF2490 domain-containing protein [Prevotella sp.]